MQIIFKIIVFVWVVFFCLSACVRKRIGNDSFVVNKDGNGNLQSEINYINDTVMQGLAKYYYYPNPKNVLKDEIDYNNGIKSGWHKHYRIDGTLESKIHWNKGLQDGETFWYYKDGKTLMSESFWVNNKQYGSAKLYYINSQLERYYSLDFFDNTLYIIKYDTLGNKTKEEGVAFSPKFIIVYASDSTQTPILEDTIKSGKEVVIKITVAQPPQTKTLIKIGKLKKGIMMELPIENSTVTYKIFFTKPGKHTIIIVGEIKDLQGNIVKHDSTTITLNVIE